MTNDDDIRALVTRYFGRPTDETPTDYERIDFKVAGMLLVVRTPVRGRPYRVVLAEENGDYSSNVSSDDLEDALRQTRRQYDDHLSYYIAQKARLPVLDPRPRRGLGDP